MPQLAYPAFQCLITACGNNEVLPGAVDAGANIAECVERGKIKCDKMRAQKGDLLNERWYH